MNQINEERKKNVIYELNLSLGTDLKDFDKVYEIRSQLLAKKDKLEKSVSRNELSVIMVCLFSLKANVILSVFFQAFFGKLRSAFQGICRNSQS